MAAGLPAYLHIDKPSRPGSRAHVVRSRSCTAFRPAAATLPQFSLADREGQAAIDAGLA